MHPLRVSSHRAHHAWVTRWSSISGDGEERNSGGPEGDTTPSTTGGVGVFRTLLDRQKELVNQHRKKEDDFEDNLARLLREAELKGQEASALEVLDLLTRWVVVVVRIRYTVGKGHDLTNHACPPFPAPSTCTSLHAELEVMVKDITLEDQIAHLNNRLNVTTVHNLVGKVRVGLRDFPSMTMVAAVYAVAGVGYDTTSDSGRFLSTTESVIQDRVGVGGRRCDVGGH